MEEVRDFMVRSLKKGKNEGSLIGRFLKLTLISFCDEASLTKCLEVNVNCISIDKISNLLVY